MEKLLTILSVAMLTLLSSCVELPDLFPNGEGEESDMLVVERPHEIVGLYGEFKDTININDSIAIRLTLQNEGTDCSDIRISIDNGQILKELGNSNYYSGLSSGSLLGNTTLGSWKNNYLIADRKPAPSVICKNDYLFEKNIEVHLGIRVKFDDDEWHYGWIVLKNQDLFGLNSLFFLRVGVNKNAGTNVRIGG